jgi:hypothetical protein
MYTIAIFDRNKVGEVFRVLQDDITKDGRFRVHKFQVGEQKTTREDRRQPGMNKVWALPAIFLSGPSGFGGAVRLTAPKPYCGNHPGPCVINPFFTTPKRRSSTLEWDDWVQFHTLVNGVLDRLQVAANVWTNPQDAKGRMWIRKGMSARVRWDYTEEYNRYRYNPTRHWNTGDASQF